MNIQLNPELEKMFNEVFKKHDEELSQEAKLEMTKLCTQPKHKELFYIKSASITEVTKSV